MSKCPYCFEELSKEKTEACPHCVQFFLDPLINVNFKGVDTKKCLFCGKSILTEAHICKYCHKWCDGDELSQVENA